MIYCFLILVFSFFNQLLSTAIFLLDWSSTNSREHSLPYNQGKAKVLQYLGDVRHNLAALDNLRLWRWWSSLDSEMLSLLYTKCYLLDLLLEALSTTSESMILGLPDLACSLSFLYTERNFLNHLVTILHIHLLYNKCFWMFLWYYGPVLICKA